MRSWHAAIANFTGTSAVGSGAVFVRPTWVVVLPGTSKR